jgi:glycopeptide antibiotics resistance protein
MAVITRLIRTHFARLAKIGKWSFLWRTWFEAVLLAYIVGIAAQTVFPSGPRKDLIAMPLIGLLVLVLLVGPLWETIVFQCLSLELTKALRVRRTLRVIFSVIPFAILHRYAGIPTVISAGIIGGFYFAFAYERWRAESLIVAVGMTFLLHSSYNLVGVLGLLLFAK